MSIIDKLKLSIKRLRVLKLWQAIDTIEPASYKNIVGVSDKIYHFIDNCGVARCMVRISFKHGIKWCPAEDIVWGARTEVLV